MDGVTWFWTVVGALFVCWVLKCVYMRYYGATGRHHTYWFGEHYPHGAVWFQHGEWWVNPRQSHPTARRFDERSNPLDHDYVWETRSVPPKTVRIPHEKEY